MARPRYLKNLIAVSLEIVRRDLRSEFELKEMMEGIEFVYHLAVAPTAKTWEEQLRNNVEPTRLVGEACLAAGVKRLIYTGTIDSYYAGAWAGTITEQTPLDKNIDHRNYYGRAKAVEEDTSDGNVPHQAVTIGYFSTRYCDWARRNSVSLRRREMGCRRRVRGMG